MTRPFANPVHRLRGPRSIPAPLPRPGPIGLRSPPGARPPSDSFSVPGWTVRSAALPSSHAASRPTPSCRRRAPDVSERAVQRGRALDCHRLGEAKRHLHPVARVDTPVRLVCDRPPVTLGVSPNDNTAGVPSAFMASFGVPSPQAGFPWVKACR